MMSRMKAFRKAAGLTQRQLADKSGVNIKLIQKYEGLECMVSNMTVRTAINLSHALGVSLCGMFGVIHRCPRKFTGDDVK